MTPQPKNPSNADIYRKLDSMDIRVAKLETWKVAEDAARAAIKELRESEARERMDSIKAREGDAWTNILKKGSVVLGIIAAILYAYLQTRSIK